jgi:hypothetical protein
MKKYNAGYRKMLLIAVSFVFLINNLIKAQTCPSSITYQNNQSLPALTSKGFYIAAQNNVKVLNGQNVKFQAGTYVALNPGFSTITGAVFTGTIVPQYPATLTVGISSVFASSGGTCPGGCLQYNLTANPTGVGPYNYSWNNGSTSQTTAAYPSTPTVYSVSVYDQCLGQTFTADILVNAIADTRWRGNPTYVIYNAISPNGDGISDDFVLRDNGKTQYAFNACYYEFNVWSTITGNGVHHSFADAGPNGFSEGDIYWDCHVQDGWYDARLRLRTCEGLHEENFHIMIQGSPYRLGIDSSLFSSSIPTTELYPNPSSGIVNFKFSADEEKDIVISVFNSIGNKVYEDHFGKQAKVSAALDLKSLAKGVYFAKIKSGDEAVFKKLIIE